MFKDSTKVTAYSKPALMLCEDRLQTYEHWSKQIKPEKWSLAKAGFFYTGTADKVTCFACGVNIMSWEEKDDPREEHEKWSPSCIYLKMTGYTSQITSRCDTQRNASVTNGRLSRDGSTYNWSALNSAFF